MKKVGGLRCSCGKLLTDDDGCPLPWGRLCRRLCEQRGMMEEFEEHMTRVKKDQSKNSKVEPAQQEKLDLQRAATLGALNVKYRPRTFKEVIGQDLVVRALRGIIKDRSAQTFLFAGPSGCGKTTLARITAAELGVDEVGILEVDAATNTGVDDMRTLLEKMNYKTFGAGGRRGVIIDECHMLSKNAWNALLKGTEEPNDFVYWFFCTTEPEKVPKTIRTRCAMLQVKEVSEKSLGVLFDDICDLECIAVDDMPGDVADLIIREAFGSPRQLLANLAVAKTAKTKKEAAELLRTAVSSDATIELCRFLIKGGSFTRAMAIVAQLDGANPEGVRIVVMNYVASCLKGAKSDSEAARFLNLLEAFSVPYNASEKLAPLYLSIGRVLLNG